MERGTRIAAQLEAGNFPLVNLFPTFLSELGPDLYFRYDTHWNPAGQRLAAELTLDEIRRRWPTLLADTPAQLSADRDDAAGS